MCATILTTAQLTSQFICNTHLCKNPCLYFGKPHSHTCSNICLRMCNKHNCRMQFSNWEIGLNIVVVVLHIIERFRSQRTEWKYVSFSSFCLVISNCLSLHLWLIFGLFFHFFFIGLFAISFQIHQSFNRKSTVHNFFYCQYICVCMCGRTTKKKKLKTK